MDAAEQMRRLVARINANAYLPTEGLTMAKQVKLAKGQEFTFKSPKSGGSKYPWDEWFTGELLMLEQDIGTGTDDKGNITGVTKKLDFNVSIDAMIPKIKTAGRRRYLVVDVSRDDIHGKRLKGALIIKSRPMMEIERIDEDKKRAYEKARDEETRKLREAKGEVDPSEYLNDDENE